MFGCFETSDFFYHVFCKNPESRLNPWTTSRPLVFKWSNIKKRYIISNSPKTLPQFLSGIALKYREIVVLEKPVYAAISAKVTFFFAIFYASCFYGNTAQRASGDFARHLLANFPSYFTKMLVNTASIHSAFCFI